MEPIILKLWSAKRCFLPDELTLYKDNFATGNGKLYILVPRAFVYFGLVDGETDIFFIEIVRQVALGTKMGELSKADLSMT